MDNSTVRQMSCVVLGGGGFIGTNLSRRLVAMGARVRGFGRQRLFPHDLDGVEWHEGDFSDMNALRAALEACDVVFHLIHNTPPQASNLDMAADVHRNVVPSLALFDLCRALGVGRVVFVSSGGTIYGRAAEIPTPETAPTDPITAYGISKLAIEKYLGLHEHLYGLSFRVLRVANPFGPYQVAAQKNQGLIAALISRALRDEPIEIWGDGSSVRDFIYIDDVVDALLAAAGDRSDARIFNVGSGRGRTVKDVVASVEKVLAKKVSVRWASARAMDVPASVLATRRAAASMGWEPKVDFETGLVQTVRWWQAREAPP